MSIGVASKQHVFCHSHRTDKSHSQTIFRNEGQSNTILTNLLWCLVQQLLCFFSRSCILDAATLFCHLQSGDCLKKLLLTASGNAGNAEDFSTVCFKIDIIKYGNTIFIINRNMFYFQTYFFLLYNWTVNVQFHFLSNHHLGQRTLSCFRSGNGSDILTFS